MTQLCTMLKQLIGKLREFRFSYILYNFFHQDKLQHNKQLYKKLQIKKPVYWNVSSVDFAKLPKQQPWLDEAGAIDALLKDPAYQQLPVQTQQWLQQWINEGYIIIPNFLEATQVDAVNNEISTLLENGSLKPLENGKIMFAFRQSTLIDRIVHDERIFSLFEFIFKQPVIAFQTINFLRGSQQRAHSDSIHMTTYPLGYLSAAWFALEDIDEARGPLFYYPGSHKLPYVMSPDFDKKSGVLKLDPSLNHHYEEKMQEVIAENKLVKKDFHARKGDLFLWHANLIHGGNPIKDPSSSRKSMVVHYFAKNVIKYHEISKRPALLES